MFNCSPPQGWTPRPPAFPSWWGFHHRSRPSSWKRSGPGERGKIRHKEQSNKVTVQFLNDKTNSEQLSAFLADQTSWDERIAALRIFGLWLVLIFCEKRITAYSGKSGHSKKLISYNGKATSKDDIFCSTCLGVQKRQRLFKVGDITHRDRAKMIQLAYECTEDKDNVDNHEHFNCSETVCLKCFGWKFWQTTNSTTTDLWDITGDAVEDINKNKKDCDKNCHPAGNALRWHKETGKEFDQLFWKKQGKWERIWLTFFLEKRRKLEKGINQLCWNPFSPQGSRRKLERIRSTFHEQYFTWSRIRWQTCRLENSRWWCSGTFSSSESAGSQWQSNFLGRGNFGIYRPQYKLRDL